ncbi:MAG: hypothetical protein KGO02_02635 [Alphaproteobacteria bacterium]|nr:hypothetical protein [Alphaproteobacteria bacterium]
MRITESYTPISLLSEIVTRQEVTAAETKGYFSHERSSHDWLTQQWSDHLDIVLSSFERYGIDVKPVQFIRDHGIDVLLRSTQEIMERRIGFQIKSNQEAARDHKRPANHESIVSILKRQAFEAFERVDEWWIVCCFDMSVYSKLVQAITSELAAGKHAKEIKVIDPREAMAFLRMSEEEVDAFCTRLLCKDDQVLRRACDEADRLGAAAPVAVGLVVSALKNEVGLISREDVWEQLSEVVADDTGDRELVLLELLDRIERSGLLLEASSASEEMEIAPAAFPGLCALFFEARVRHDLDEQQSGLYMAMLAMGKGPAV